VNKIELHLLEDRLQHTRPAGKRTASKKG
jgi:hypothetical protein